MCTKSDVQNSALDVVVRVIVVFVECFHQQ